MTAETTHDRLAPARIAGFTIGDFGYNLFWQSISLYLLFFYTEAVGLSAIVAGLIYMIASIVDAVSDPFMGAIADRTRTRWGRYRPYLLFGSPLVAVCFVLLYYKPPLEGMWLAAWMLATHIIFRLAYTIANVPYTALSARLTKDAKLRGTIAASRIVFATLGGLAVAATTQPIAAKFGGDDLAHGYMVVAAIFAVVATLVMPIVFFSTKEPDEDEAEVVPESLSDYWPALRDNSALWTMVLGMCAAALCSTALGKSVLYYYKYYIGDEAAGGLALQALALSGFLLVPLWAFVARRLGKRNAWLIGCLWGLAGLAYFALTDIRTADHMLAYLLFMHVATIGFALGFWSMLPDTVEYGEWRTGMRTESFVFGLGQFFLKVALGLGAGLYGWLLGLIGYVPNVRQSPETLADMKLLMVALPAVGLGAAFLLMLRYPLTGNRHAEIVEEIAARRIVPGAVPD